VPSDLLLELVEERRRQDELWGEQNHTPHEWLAILMEEVGEIAKDVAEGRVAGNYRTELIQVAAVAMAAVESLDRAGPTFRTWSFDRETTKTEDEFLVKEQA
jgi:NTP pyrophosphatase (non-canonical NTP hydrolase)